MVCIIESTSAGFPTDQMLSSNPNVNPSFQAGAQSVDPSTSYTPPIHRRKPVPSLPAGVYSPPGHVGHATGAFASNITSGSLNNASPDIPAGVPPTVATGKGLSENATDLKRRQQEAVAAHSSGAAGPSKSPVRHVDSGIRGVAPGAPVELPPFYSAT